MSESPISANRVDAANDPMMRTILTARAKEQSARKPKGTSSVPPSAKGPDLPAPDPLPARVVEAPEEDSSSNFWKELFK